MRVDFKSMEEEMDQLAGYSENHVKLSFFYGKGGDDNESRISLYFLTLSSKL